MGETAAVILTAGSSFMMPDSLFSPIRTMAVHFYILAREGISMEMAYATGAALIVLILIINTAANLLLFRYVRRRLRERRGMGDNSKIVIRNFHFYYGSFAALKEINLSIRPNQIFAILGPARSGKTTLLKSLNRLTDLIFGTNHKGQIFIDGQDIYGPEISLPELRRQGGHGLRPAHRPPSVDLRKCRLRAPPQGEQGKGPPGRDRRRSPCRRRSSGTR